MIIHEEKSQAPLLLVEKPYLHNDDCACADSKSLIVFSESYDKSKSNDCACEVDERLLPSPSFSADTFVQTPHTHISLLRDDYVLAFSPLAPYGPSVLNKSGYQRWRTFSWPRPISQPFDRSLIAQNLLQSARGELRLSQQKNRTLTAWMHITNACNLDCVYCYVCKTSARMSKEIGLQAIDALFDTARQEGFKEIKLKYAGGEPTLHLSLVRRLHHHALMLANRYGISVREVLLTNGVRLRPDDARWLKDADIKLAISLDGIGLSHDRQRPMKNGSGSFSAIAHTIDHVLLPLGIQPDITLTITGLNAQGIADAVRWVLQRDLPLSLNFYRENVNNHTPDGWAIEEDKIIQGMKAAYEVFEEVLPTRPFIDGILDRVQSIMHTRTCGVDNGYIVITHEGKLSQCQMLLEQAVGDITQGINLNRLRSRFIHNIPVDQKNDCRTCPFRYRCSGGCPLETFRLTGRWDARSPHCNIYKTLYPLALRLEGLRLLKVNAL